MTHTPGPWVVGDDDDNGQVIVDGPSYSICRCHHHCVGTIELEMRANAHLIAAAPDLLAMLKHAEMLISGEFPHSWPIHSKIAAAIAKAEGRAE
jgi:hypothetical protein